MKMQKEPRCGNAASGLSLFLYFAFCQMTGFPSASKCQ